MNPSISANGTCSTRSKDPGMWSSSLRPVTCSLATS
nr:MAG TPA: hypothetical protein [Caudoviricetes sp.]